MSNLQARPDWDSYFMAMAFLVAQRSPDQLTKHGSIIVDSFNHVLSTGYNGHPAGGDESIYDWTSDAKYSVALHSEANSILACEHKPRGAKVYITGKPCSNCSLLLIQAGIKEIIYGPVESKMDIKWDLSSKLLANHGVSYRAFVGAQLRVPNGAVDILQIALDKLTDLSKS